MKKITPPFPHYRLIMDAFFWAQSGMALICIVGGSLSWAAAYVFASATSLYWWWEVRP